MDYYISEFQKNSNEKDVKDYFVYLEKKNGLSMFNIFSPSKQIVLYLTDRNVFLCMIQLTGVFSEPIKIEQGALDSTNEGKVIIYKGQTFKYVRKWKKGIYSNLTSFYRSMVERGLLHA